MNYESNPQKLINGNNYYMNHNIQNQIYKATPHSKNTWANPIKSNEQAAMPTYLPIHL